MFERQRQYSSLLSRLEADQCKVCELQRSGTTPLTSTYVTFSRAVFAYCKQSKTGGGNGLGMRLFKAYESSNSLTASSIYINTFPKSLYSGKIWPSIEEGGEGKGVGSHYSIPWLCAICQCPMLAFPLMRGRGNRTISPAAYTSSVAFMCYKWHDTDDN